jgi:hypothetical protein
MGLVVIEMGIFQQSLICVKDMNQTMCNLIKHQNLNINVSNAEN